MKLRLILLPLLAALSLGSGGCTWFKSKKAPPTPAAPAPQKPLHDPERPKPKPPMLEPPQVSQPPAQVPSEQPSVVLPAPPPPPQPKPAKRPVRSRRTTPPKPVPAVPESAPEPAATTVIPVAPPQAPPPKLGEMLTTEQARQYEAELEQDVVGARTILTELHGRNLSREQSETLARVRSFIQQAEQARGKDLRTAGQLARRAALLAKDLRDSLH